MATPALVAELGRLAGVPDLGTWRDLGGSWSTNVLVAGPPRALVFRVHQRFVTLDRLLAEQHVRRELAAAGLPTVTALPLFAGSTTARLASGNLVEVEAFRPADARMDTPDRLVDGFRLLGALHDALQDVAAPAAARSPVHANHLDLGVAVGRTRAGAARTATWGDPALTSSAERLARHVTRVAALETAWAPGQRRQLVHGDFWDDNVLFADGRVAALLDFGFMAERTRVDDLALPIWYLLLGRGPLGPLDRALVADLLDAYDRGSRRPLGRAERLSLPLVLARQPARLAGRWLLVEDDEARAEVHARRAVAELPLAASVLGDLAAWQRDLTRGAPADPA